MKNFYRQHSKAIWIFCIAIQAFFLTTKSFSQNEPNWDWWAQNISQRNLPTDGRWRDYLIISPGFMGPNALPVPEISKGRVNNELRLETGLQGHFSPGDKTYNTYMDLNLNLAKDRVSLLVYGYLAEHFAMDTLTRDKRMLSGFYYNPEGWAVGDVYFGTEIQLWKAENSFADVMLRMITRAASGGKEGAARYTDTPGYYFDLSLGKTKTFEKMAMRTNFMLGFYVWQTNILGQNDALLYGIGSDFIFEKFDISTSLDGYIGYIDDGDKPMLWRVEFNRKREKIDYLVQYQLGLIDNDYHAIKLSLIYHISL